MQKQKRRMRGEGTWQEHQIRESKRRRTCT
nr:MAG TPA: hypothetical protein [Caudoviricetes sp.]